MKHHYQGFIYLMFGFIVMIGLVIGTTPQTAYSQEPYEAGPPHVEPGPEVVSLTEVGPEDIELVEYRTPYAQFYQRPDGTVYAIIILVDAPTGKQGRAHSFSSADTYVSSQQYGYRYCHQDHTYVGYNPAWWKAQTRSFFKFPLPSIPANHRVKSAKLELYAYYKEAGDYRANVYRITSNWSEGNCPTWTHQPNIDGTVRASTVVQHSHYNPGFHYWDITSLVQDWYNGVPNYGLSVRGSDENAKGGAFRTKEKGSYVPALIVEFEAAPITISGTVTDLESNPLPNVTVTLDNGMTTTTNENGEYIFTNVSQGNHTVNVMSYGPNPYVLETLTVNTNVSTKVPTIKTTTYYIAGFLSHPIRNVPVTAGQKTVKTDQNGYYQIKYLIGGVYEVTAEREGFEISPSSFSNPINLNANAPHKNFHFITKVGCNGTIINGICVKKLEKSYIAMVDLYHRDIEVNLAYTGRNETKFERKTIFGHENDSKNNYTKYHYHAAINASAFECDGDVELTKPLPWSDDPKHVNTLFIDGHKVRYGKKSSVFVYTQDDEGRGSAKILWATKTITDGGFETEQELESLIKDSDFAIGFRMMLLDDGEVTINEKNNDGKDYYTGIGVSKDGSRIYLVSSHEKRHLTTFAGEFQKIQGVDRAILLDGGGSSQFASMGANSGTTLYNRVRDGAPWVQCGWESKPRKIINAVIAYNSASQITGDQKELVDCKGQHFKDGEDEDNELITQFDDGSFEGCEANQEMLVQRRDKSNAITIHYQRQPFTDTYSLEAIGYFYEMKATHSDGTPAQLVKPYSVTISYEQDQVWKTITETELALYFLRDGQWEKEPTSVVDTENNLITAHPQQLGYAAILAPIIPTTLTLISQANIPLSYTIDSYPLTLKPNLPETFTEISPEFYNVGIDPSSYSDSRWALVSVTCKDQQGQAVEPLVDHDNFQAEIPVRAGQHVSCTFLNEPADYSPQTSHTIFLPIIIK